MYILWHFQIKNVNHVLVNLFLYVIQFVTIFLILYSCKSHDLYTCILVRGWLMFVVYCRIQNDITIMTDMNSQ